MGVNENRAKLNSACSQNPDTMFHRANTRIRSHPVVNSRAAQPASSDRHRQRSRFDRQTIHVQFFLSFSIVEFFANLSP